MSYSFAEIMDSKLADLEWRINTQQTMLEYAKATRPWTKEQARLTEDIQFNLADNKAYAHQLRQMKKQLNEMRVQ